MRWWAALVVRVRRRAEEVWGDCRSRRVSMVNDVVAEWQQSEKRAANAAF